MQDIFNSNAFGLVTMAAALQKVPYQPTRCRDMKLFDEKPINTTSIAVEERDGLLSLISSTPRGASGAVIGDKKAKVRSFTAPHLSRLIKIMADEVQDVRVFGSEDTALTIEKKRDEKLEALQRMHELTWEYHRLGAILGKVLDADGATELLDLYAAFGVTQETKDFELTTATTDIRAVCEGVADVIDDELGGSTYERIHVFAGGTFYDSLIKHKFVQDYLKQIAAAGDTTLIRDLRGGVQGFTIGPLTFERARRWKVKTPDGTTINMIDPDLAYAFPVGASDQDGSMFRGFFAPQPFVETVNRLNPPLVVKGEVDPKGRFIEMEGVSCPLYINTRPKAVVKLTKT